jgi:hypothetical protein
MFNEKFYTMKNSLSIFAILILAAIMIAFTESGTITGKVTDVQGQALSGVTVTVKGTITTTTTDSNGSYRINAGTQATVLVFSLPGYSSVEEKIAGRSIINVRMSVQAMAAEDISAIVSREKRDMASKSMSMTAPSSGAGYQAGRSFQRYNNILIPKDMPLQMRTDTKM